MIDAFGGMLPRAIHYALLDGFIFALFLRGKVAIGLSFFDQFLRRRAMLVGIVGLKDQSFVVIQSQPFQSFDNRTRRFVCRTLQIGVFDAEEELASYFASEQPIEE